jgi:hypothetical protein
MNRLAVVAMVLSAGGCSTSNPECDCASPRLDVNVPEARSLDVSSVALSGPACAGVTPSCDHYGVAGGCVDYGFGAVAAGDCHVDVSFQSGEVFSADVAVTRSTGCCAGFYPDPVSAGQIDVPAAGDAGA